MNTDAAAARAAGGESPPPAPILYEDRHLLVVDKPAGILTIPDPEGNQDIVSLLDRWVRSRDQASPPPWAIRGQEPVRVHPCHRLDRDTSGLLVCARGKTAQKTMMELFARRETSKVYLCAVNGRVGPDQGLLKTPVDGKDALTQYQVLGRSEAWSLLKCKIHTGRTNQIRIHCAAMGHPLVGDDRFGRRRDFAFPAKRTLLHAWYLAFPWPWDEPPLPPVLAGAEAGKAFLVAPPPPDLAVLLASCGLDADGNRTTT